MAKPLSNDCGLDNDKNLRMAKHNGTFLSQIGRVEHHNSNVLYEHMSNQKVSNYSP